MASPICQKTKKSLPNNFHPDSVGLVFSLIIIEGLLQQPARKGAGEYFPGCPSRVYPILQGRPDRRRKVTVQNQHP